MEHLNRTWETSESRRVKKKTKLKSNSNVDYSFVRQLDWGIFKIVFASFQLCFVQRFGERKWANRFIKWNACVCVCVSSSSSSTNTQRQLSKTATVQINETFAIFFSSFSSLNLPFSSVSFNLHSSSTVFLHRYLFLRLPPSLLVTHKTAKVCRLCTSWQVEEKKNARKKNRIEETKPFLWESKNFFLDTIKRKVKMN